jgi:hypothetical protein
MFQNSRKLAVSCFAVVSLGAAVFLTRQSAQTPSTSSKAAPAATPATADQAKRGGAARSVDSPRQQAAYNPGIPARPPTAREAEERLQKGIEALGDATDAELAQALSAVDQEIETGDWIGRANRGQLSADERLELDSILARRDAVTVAQGERLLASLQAAHPALP